VLAEIMVLLVLAAGRVMHRADVEVHAGRSLYVARKP
jgi:hypothetical protein